MRQIVLDTETTGLDWKTGDRLIEIAGVEIIDRKLTGRHYHVYVNPQRDIDAGAVAVHGITLDFLADKPLFKDVADEFCAFVAGSEALIETLIQFARPYIYTTSQPPAVACATLAALQLVREEGWRRELLHTLIQRFRRGATALGLDLMLSATPIQPILVGDSARALALSAALRRRGILVTAIRPPTVPAGSARLRVTLTAAHREAHVDLLLDALAQAMAELPPDADK